MHEPFSKHEFSATIHIINANPYVRPPNHVLEKIFQQAGKKTSPVPIRGEINGAPFQQSLVKYQGDWRLYVNIIMAKAANLSFSKSISEIVGEKATFEITFNPKPPTYEMIPFLQKALENNSAAFENWKKLIESRQKEVLRYFGRLKSEEAKERNLKKLLEVLTGEEGRFMARDWKKGK